ncbi:flagellar hook-length control protein FliK [Cereibacter sphaeroides]|nr:flagellar hook-length control protein FliK [Cereibacter sphaeroides]
MLPAANAEKQTTLFALTTSTAAPRAVTPASDDGAKRDGPSFGSVFARLAEKEAQRQSGEEPQMETGNGPEKSAKSNNKTEAESADPADDQAATVVAEGPTESDGVAIEAADDAASREQPAAEEHAGRDVEKTAAVGTNKHRESVEEPMDENALAALATPFTGYEEFLTLAESPDGADSPQPVADEGTVASALPAATESLPDAAPIDAPDVPAPTTPERQMSAEASTGRSDQRIEGGERTASARVPAADAMFQGRFSLSGLPMFNERADSSRPTVPPADVAPQVPAEPALSGTGDGMPADPADMGAQTLSTATVATPAAVDSGNRTNQSRNVDMSLNAAVSTQQPVDSTRPAAPAAGATAQVGATGQPIAQPAMSAASEVTPTAQPSVSVAQPSPSTEGIALKVARELRATITMVPADSPRAAAVAQQTLLATGMTPSAQALNKFASDTKDTQTDLGARDIPGPRRDAYMTMRAMSAPAPAPEAVSATASLKAASATETALTPMAAGAAPFGAQSTESGLPVIDGDGTLMPASPQTNLPAATMTAVGPSAALVAAPRGPRAEATHAPVEAPAMRPTPATASAKPLQAAATDRPELVVGELAEKTALQSEQTGDSGRVDTDRVAVETLSRNEGAQRSEASAARPAPGAETARQIASQIGAHLEGPDAVKAANGGFDLRLDPDELGQVRLRLVTQDNASVLLVQADRPETLDLMRRHIAALEQDLRNMGHENLTLRFSGQGTQDQGWAGAQNQNSNAQRGGDGGSFLSTRATDIQGSAPSAPSQPAQRLGARDSLDLRL